MGPVVIVHEFILRQPPFLKGFLNFFWDTGIIGHKPQQTFLIIFMFFDDFSPTFVAGFRIIIVHPDIVTAKWTMVVGIRFSIGNDIEFVKPLPPSRVKNPNQQLILGRVVIVGSWKWNPIVRMIGHAGPETISLHFMVTLPLLSRMLPTNTWKKPAGRITRDPIGVYWCIQYLKMVPVVKHTCLYPIPFLIIDAVSLPADMVAYPGGGHQVPFIGGIDKHLPFKLLPT